MQKAASCPAAWFRNMWAAHSSVHVGSPANDTTDAAHKHRQRRWTLDAVHKRIANNACKYVRTDLTGRFRKAVISQAHACGFACPPSVAGHHGLAERVHRDKGRGQLYKKTQTWCLSDIHFQDHV